MPSPQNVSQKTGRVGGARKGAKKGAREKDGGRRRGRPRDHANVYAIEAQREPRTKVLMVCFYSRAMHARRRRSRVISRAVAREVLHYFVHSSLHGVNIPTVHFPCECWITITQLCSHRFCLLLWPWIKDQAQYHHSLREERENESDRDTTRGWACPNQRSRARAHSTLFADLFDNRRMQIEVQDRKKKELCKVITNKLLLHRTCAAAHGAVTPHSS